MLHTLDMANTALFQQRFSIKPKMDAGGVDNPIEPTREKKESWQFAYLTRSDGEWGERLLCKSRIQNNDLKIYTCRYLIWR